MAEAIVGQVAPRPLAHLRDRPFVVALPRAPGLPGPATRRCLRRLLVVVDEVGDRAGGTEQLVSLDPIGARPWQPHALEHFAGVCSSRAIHVLEQAVLVDATVPARPLALPGGEL